MDLGRRQVGFLSLRATRVPNLAALLEAEPRYLAGGVSDGVDMIAGWGRRKRARAAWILAAREGLAFLTVEDGFLRSVERDDPPLSLVVDDVGIYFDCSAPSRLEALISRPIRADEEQRAKALIRMWREGRVSKYNHSRDFEGALPPRYVMVVDQICGDASVIYGEADAASFARMLEAALSENPDCAVVVKVHPDVLARGKKGYLSRQAVEDPRVTVIADDCHPARLIEEAEAVYTVTSQIGFEALIWGKRVRTFGMPFYAGWGLTDDALPAPARRQNGASLEALVHAALVVYPRYVDHETGTRCEVEDVLSHIALQRRLRSRFPRKVEALGFSRWKRPILRRFLSGSQVRFRRRASDVAEDSTVAVWGCAIPEGLPDGVRIIHIEDGFLRSVGLGADLTRPLSWVCDPVGLYYDSTRLSRLEQLLAETEFDAALLTRAEALRRRIVDAGITKYNLRIFSWQRPDRSPRVILVPGQVEDDAAIRQGAPLIRTNLQLLRTVRETNPDAYIVYKPHPDVTARLRRRGAGESDSMSFCDEVVHHADMACLLHEVDEVHTMTSLAGFEALLRGRNVVCYGQPFYAGWGLTRDMAPVPRRTRRLTLDQLIAASLILYPTYVCRRTGRFTTPERAVEQLVNWRDTETEGFSWRRTLRPLLRLSKQLRAGPGMRGSG
ncbi:capsular polysaccharide biosynthesis protein [Chelativorans sp. Marseille-P2723]|uniref:capsular polysaccharide biosynthesis protein n=1 Tax=Chelativorans sp. Marseille-P2723 TaxID=2709133 RepID=UPI001570D5E7|nr:capsular polysaccharide biosynthesis protein [Chelativorans sp. Marseille-P2723]